MSENTEGFGNGEKCEGENDLSSGEGFSKEELSQIEQTGTIASIE